MLQLPAGSVDARGDRSISSSLPEIAGESVHIIRPALGSSDVSPVRIDSDLHVDPQPLQERRVQTNAEPASIRHAHFGATTCPSEAPGGGAPPRARAIPLESRDEAARAD